MQPHYPNIAPKFKWGGNKLIEGSIFIKNDNGLSCNCKSERAIKFWHDMHFKGIHLGPGLLNKTSSNQEMDDWIQDFKGKYNAHIQEVFEEKTYAHELALKNRQDNGETEIKGAVLTNDNLPVVIYGHPDIHLRSGKFFFVPQR